MHSKREHAECHRTVHGKMVRTETLYRVYFTTVEQTKPKTIEEWATHRNSAPVCLQPGPGCSDAGLRRVRSPDCWDSRGTASSEEPTLPRGGKGLQAPGGENGSVRGREAPVKKMTLVWPRGYSSGQNFRHLE